MAGPDMRRRQVIAAIGAGAITGPCRVGAEEPALRMLRAPEAMVQIAAGGPTALLGVGASGTLYALAPDHGAHPQLGTGIDPATPLAVGHGRVAARRLDGALWVYEAGRRGVTGERTLAPHAGLLVLPLAVIGIVADGTSFHVARFEPRGAGTWGRIARSGTGVLPDARPVQADLDGAGDGGHVVVLASPDTERYRHAVLGDAIEATRLVLLERHGLEPMRELALAAPHVFEDIAPRRVALGARDGLLTVRSGPQGAQLVLADADPTSAGALRIAASGPPLGSANRWLSPTTDGTRWLAVHTPHIGGVLHEYRRDGERLHATQVLGGVSNHHLGSRQLDLAAWHGRHLAVPDQSGRRLLLLDGRSGWQHGREWPLPARVSATVSLGAAAGIAVLHEDGSVAVVRPSV